jgi:hypothetical protein
MISDFAAEISFATSSVNFIVPWQVIVSVVVGDNVAAEIVWGAISVMVAGPDTHPGPQQNPSRCSPAQRLATGIVLCNNGVEQSGRQHGSVGQKRWTEPT